MIRYVLRFAAATAVCMCVCVAFQYEFLSLFISFDLLD